MSDGWRPIRTTYLIAPRLGHHVSSIVLSVICIVGLGLFLMIAGSLAAPSSPTLGHTIQGVGWVVTMSFVFSWLGHIPLAFALHWMMKRDLGGWLVVLAVSCGIGGFWSEVMSLPIALPYALASGPVQAWALRRGVLARMRVM
ncbi:hypothetical protein [Pacificoceanicola onchidii]|uniref:hypothetical protein n=1 Tax=Pacificoceanicola onchidii TaxID=2562685 RepID=UPI0010A5902E|nr:hypothetical protein [Pacificoceanicola onchidii]